MKMSLPVTTIGGYLGSGKTTLVNHLLRNANGLRLAVLVNEFGELAIDEDLIEAEGDDIISIAGGCVCCSFGNDMMGALIDLTKMSPPPDHVLIEASGVALPGSIVAALGLVEDFRADGIVVLADADSVRKNAANVYVGDTIDRQLADADIVIMNKLDLVDEIARNDLSDWLSIAAPGATQIPAEQGQVELEAVLGCLRPKQAVAAIEHHGSPFESFVLQPATGTNLNALAQNLATGSFGVVRAKGFGIDQDGVMKTLHVVGTRWQVSVSSGEHDSGIVCIGLKGQLGRSEIEQMAQSISAAV
jgi:G3E family GTPase